MYRPISQFRKTSERSAAPAPQAREPERSPDEDDPRGGTESPAASPHPNCTENAMTKITFRRVAGDDT